MWRVNYVLLGAVLGFGYLVLGGILDERDHMLIDEVDCAKPLKPGKGRVTTVVVDHVSKVRCKA